VNATDKNFNTHIQNSDKLVLVEFWASWCGACKKLQSTIHQISHEFANNLKVVKVNIDDCPKTSKNFEIKAFPTLMLFKNGKHLDTQVGALPKNTLIEWINGTNDMLNEQEFVQILPDDINDQDPVQISTVEEQKNQVGLVEFSHPAAEITV
jgi:thioredoxin 1